MNAEYQPPTLAELLQHKLSLAGPKDKIVNIKIEILTAKMILRAEQARANVKCKQCGAAVVGPFMCAPCDVAERGRG